jgi:hypothetical protein
MERVRFHPGTGHILLSIRSILLILSKNAVFDRIYRIDWIFSPARKTDKKNDSTTEDTESTEFFM